MTWVNGIPLPLSASITSLCWYIDKNVYVCLSFVMLQVEKFKEKLRKTEENLSKENVL